MPDANDRGDGGQPPQHTILLCALLLIMYQMVLLNLQAQLLVRHHNLQNSALLCIGFMYTIQFHPGFRRTFGQPGVRNAPYIDVVLKMMGPESEGGNHRQFYANFRMSPQTFTWLRDKLWLKAHPELDPDKEARPGRKKRGRKPDHKSFTKRLLMSIWLLVTNCTFHQLGEQWGEGAGYFDYRHMLFSNIAQLKKEVIRMDAHTHTHHATARTRPRAHDRAHTRDRV